MTTLSPSRYEESPGFGPHKAGHPTGGRAGYHADSNSVFLRPSIDRGKLNDHRRGLVEGAAPHVACCLCSCMAWEITPRLNPWELVGVFLSEGSTVMTVAEGQAPDPCQPHRSPCRPSCSKRWGVRGSNPRPRDYESPALTC